MSEKCNQCGSTRIIPEVFVVDKSPRMIRNVADDALEVRVMGAPDAWVFKDPLYGQLVACICGECGHAEFRVKNPRELYEKYLKATGQ